MRIRHLTAAVAVAVEIPQFPRSVRALFEAKDWAMIISAPRS